MAYVGTTAGATSSNPPIQIARGLAGNIFGSSVGWGTGMWLYHTTDASTVMEAPTYFTDAFYLGMRQQDIVMGAAACSIGSTVPVAYFGILGAVTTAGAGLSTGGTFTSTFT